MKIYFTLITFQGLPLLWDYDENANKATCTFFLKSNRSIQNKKEVLAALREHQFSGITITQDMAIIEDLESFDKIYSSVVYTPSLSVPKLDMEKLSRILEVDDNKPTLGLLSRSGSKSQENLSFFRPPEKKDKLTRSNSLILLGSTKSSSSEKENYSPHLLFDSPKSCFDSLLLEHLIVKHDDPTLWGDTVGYKSYFSEKNNADRSAHLESYLRNASSFHKENLYAFNEIMCSEKSKIIILIEQLLKKALDPAYREWKQLPDTKCSSKYGLKLFQYIRGAVRNTMINNAFNYELTEYEKLTPEEIKEKFHGNEAAYKFANLEIRKARARVMTMDWIALVDEECPLECGGSKDIMSQTAIDTFASFKKYLISNEDRVEHATALLNKIQRLLVQSGEKERDYKLLTDKLRLQLADKTSCIGEYTSLRGIISKFLIAGKEQLKKHVPSEETVQKFIQEVMQKIIITLYEDPKVSYTPYIAKLNKTDDDIYLNMDWTSAINGFFKEYQWDTMAKNLSDSKKSEVSLKYLTDKACSIIKTKSLILTRTVKLNEDQGLVSLLPGDKTPDSELSLK